MTPAVQTQINGTTLELVQGDITRQPVDAVVNAANSLLQGGGGVDGAIHRVGGPAIMAECLKIGGCPTGSAVITTGGKLLARHVIHAVGPRHTPNSLRAPEMLASAYRTSLRVAQEHGVETIAFPSISTGAYGYPIDEASRIALRTVIEFIRDNPGVFELVRFVLFTASALKAYRQAFEELTAEPTAS